MASGSKSTTGGLPNSGPPAPFATSTTSFGTNVGSAPSDSQQAPDLSQAPDQAQASGLGGLAPNAIATPDVQHAVQNFLQSVGLGHLGPQSLHTSAKGGPPIKYNPKAVRRDIHTKEVAFLNKTNKQDRNDWRVSQRRLFMILVDHDEPLAQALCRSVFYQALGIEIATDIFKCRHADVDTVAAYEDDGGPGPSATKVQFDFTVEGESLWNDAVYSIILQKVRVAQAADKRWAGLSQRSDDYIITELESVFANLRYTWRQSRPQIDDHGNVESYDQAADRTFETHVTKYRRSRHNKRRKDVSVVLFT